MLVVVTYDIAVSSDGGTKRLTRVAKLCSHYGQRVQNSVFECLIDNLELQQLKHQLTTVIDPEQDSLRFYKLGKNYQNKITHIGTKSIPDLSQPLIM